MILYLILGEVMQRKIFWFILLLFMGLILNGCGGGDKEESDSITFISDSTIYVKKSEIKKFEFPIQATSKLNSRLEFQLKGEDAKFFKLNTLNGILIFNIYYYNRGEIKSTYKIDIVASVVEGSVINNTTTIINKKSSKLSKKQSITIIIGEKPTSVVVVPVVSTPTPIAPLLTPTSKTMTKGYLIDAPIAGVNYSCGIKSNLIRGKTTLTGEFSCEVTPVVFSIGDYFLGTLNEFTLDSKVYPQDLLEISRDNFNDTRLIKMIRLLQSLDDDGDISDVITISSRVADKFKEYTNEFDLETLVSLADKELISENDALLHLRANIPTPTPYIPTPTPYIPTPTPYVPTPTPYVSTPTPYVPTPTPYIPTPTPFRDIIAPTIQLRGEKIITVEEGKIVRDPGFIVTDNIDKELDALVQISGGDGLIINGDSIGTYSIRYNVTDSAGNKAIEQIRIVHVVKAENRPPQVDAGEDISVEVNHMVMLRGSGRDSDGMIVNYEWKKDDTVLANTEVFDYIPTVVGVDILTLTVTDDDGLTQSDNISITVLNKSETTQKWITPSQSTCTEYEGYWGNERCDSRQYHAKTICSESGGTLPLIEELKDVIIQCGGVIDDHENNKNNTSYQTCYQNLGFTSKYWSSSLDQYDDLGLYVDFQDGSVNLMPPSNSLLVRCLK